MSESVTVETNAKEVAEQFRITERELSRMLRGAPKECAKGVLKDYQATTATWNHKVKFEMLEEATANSATVIVGTDDLIYTYVDKGTQEHIIAPKKPGGRLCFHVGYNAKTTPGIIGSKKGGPFGAKVVRAWVLHPGTKPRNFSKLIEKKHKNALRDYVWRRMESIINRRKF